MDQKTNIYPRNDYECKMYGPNRSYVKIMFSNIEVFPLCMLRYLCLMLMPFFSIYVLL